MANQWFDGFSVYSAAGDLLTLNGAVYTSGINNFSKTAGRFGGGAISMQNGDHCVVALPSPVGELWFGGAFNFADTGNRIISFDSAFGAEASIQFHAGSYTWNFYRGSQSVLLGSQSLYVSLSAWHWLEFRFKLDPTAGAFEVWADNTQLYALTGVNTRANSSASTITNFDIYTQSASTALLCDLYINDTTGTAPLNGRLGDSRVLSYAPNSDAGPNNGTPSAGGTHYGCVNEAQWDTTSYDTLTNTSGQGEYFGTNSALIASQTVLAAKVTVIDQKSDAGSANLKVGLKSGSTWAYGPSTGLLTSWAAQNLLLSNNPATSAAWTYSALNAAVIGAEVA